MVTLGVDAHKRTHTIVAADDNGSVQAERTVAATPAGHLEGLRWAQQWTERRWAIEDCRHLSRRLATDLLVAGEAVVRVPPKLTAGARRSARTRGKSDPIDALAVARAALREPDLPVAQLDGATREIRLLVDHRDDLVAERTRLENRLRWHLHELQPGDEPAARSLNRRATLTALDAALACHEGVVARIARELLVRCRELTEAVNALEREIRGRVAQLAPTLLALLGCGALSAAKIVGEVGDVSRFRSRNAFAMHNGTAPIPVWSGNRERFRLNRGGNRQINCALHRIAITQLQRPGLAQDYVGRRRAAGDTKTESIRALRRRISDEVYRRLRADQQQPSTVHTRHAPVAA
ncbi:MAG: IS110 family transposase [Thermoplasmata archaeon]